MPIKKYMLHVDGKDRQVSVSNIDKYGIDSYAKSYPDAAIRMRDERDGDYDIPIGDYQRALDSGLRPFVTSYYKDEEEEITERSTFKPDSVAYMTPPATAVNVPDSVVKGQESTQYVPETVQTGTDVPVYVPESVVKGPKSAEKASEKVPFTVDSSVLEQPKDSARVQPAVPDSVSVSNLPKEEPEPKSGTQTDEQKLTKEFPLAPLGSKYPLSYTDHLNELVSEWSGAPMAYPETRGEQMARTYKANENAVDKIWNGELKGVVDGLIEQGKEEGRSKVREYQKTVYGNGGVFAGAAGMGDQSHREYAKATDAKKVIDGVQKYLAEKNGSSSGEVGGESNPLQEQLMQKVYDYLVQKNTPKSTAEYIMRNVFSGSILGQLMSMGDGKSYEQRQIEAGGLQQYEPTAGEEVGAMAASIGTDLPIMGLTGLAGGAAGNALLGNATRRLMASGLSEAAARGIATRAAQQTAMKWGLRTVSEAVNFGTLEGLGSVVGQTYQTGDVDLGKAATAMAKGAATGAVMGVFGVSNDKMRRLMEGGLGETAGRALGYASSLGGRTAILTGSSVFGQYLEDQNFDINNVDWTKEIAHAGLMNLGFDILGAVKRYHAYRKSGIRMRDIEKLDFTKEDIEQLNRIGIEGKDAQELAESILQVKDANELRRGAVEGEGLVGNDFAFFSQELGMSKEGSALGQLLSHPNVDLSTKAKVAYLMTGMQFRLAPNTNVSDVQEQADGSFTVEKFNPSGQTNETHRFRSREDAEAYRVNTLNETMPNQVNVLEGMMDDAGKVSTAIRLFEMVAKQFGVSKEQVADAYARGRRGEVLEGNPRKAYETIDNILRSVQSVEDYHYSPTQLKRRMEEGYGRERGWMDKVLKKKYNSLNETEKQAYDEYVANMKAILQGNQRERVQLGDSEAASSADRTGTDMPLLPGGGAELTGSAGSADASGETGNTVGTGNNGAVLSPRMRAMESGAALYAEHDPAKMRQAVVRQRVAYLRLYEAALGTMTSEDIEAMVEADDAGREAILSALDTNQRRLAEDYLAQTDLVRGLEEALDNTHSEEADAAESLVQKMTSPTGNVVTVTLGKHGDDTHEYGVVVSGLDADGNAVSPERQVIVVPIESKNWTPDFSTFDEGNAVSMVLDNSTEISSIHPDVVADGMLGAYQADLDLLEQAPVAVGQTIALGDEEGTVVNAQVVGQSLTGGWLVLEEGQTEPADVSDVELKQMMYNAERAPILAEYAELDKAYEREQKELQRQAERAAQKAREAEEAARIAEEMKKPINRLAKYPDGKPDYENSRPEDVREYLVESLGLEGAVKSIRTQRAALEKQVEEQTEKINTLIREDENNDYFPDEAIAARGVIKAEQDKLAAMNKSLDFWKGVERITAGPTEAEVQETVTRSVAQQKAAKTKREVYKPTDEYRKMQREMADSDMAMTVLEDLEPHTPEELAATLIAGGVRLMKADETVGDTVLKGVQSMTGYGAKDLQRLNFVFATRANGGVSVGEFGEMLEREAQSYGVRFDGKTTEEGSNALLSLLSDVEKMGDITHYVERNRMREASALYEDEQAAIEEAKDAAAWEQFGMSYADYRKLQDATTDLVEIRQRFTQDFWESDEYIDFISNFAENRSDYGQEGNDIPGGGSSSFEAGENDGRGNEIASGGNQEPTGGLQPSGERAAVRQPDTETQGTGTENRPTNDVGSGSAVPDGEGTRGVEEYQRVIDDVYTRMPSHAETVFATSEADIDRISGGLFGEDVLAEVKDCLNDKTTAAFFDKSMGVIFVFPHKHKSVKELVKSLWHENAHYFIERSKIEEKNAKNVAALEVLKRNYPEAYARLIRTYEPKNVPGEAFPTLVEEIVENQGEEALMKAHIPGNREADYLFYNFINFTKDGFGPNRYRPGRTGEETGRVGEIRGARGTTGEIQQADGRSREAEPVSSVRKRGSDGPGEGSGMAGQPELLSGNEGTESEAGSGKEVAGLVSATGTAGERRHEGAYSIEPAQYTTKKGKVLDMYLVKFDQERFKDFLGWDVVKKEASELRGWKDRKLGGYLMRSREDAQRLADFAVMRAEMDAADAESLRKEIEKAREEVNTSPTEAQKEAGNYKMGHVKIDGYDITIENPKGSVRSGKDANGKEWRTTMNNDYGYIRGTKAVDGDHIDVFLSDNPEEGRVFVVDQSNQDGSFDESKVMYGFNSLDEARNAYLSNYDAGWESRIMAITEVSKEEFKKWIDSSTRKTKAFSEYKSVKPEEKPDFNFDSIEELKDASRTVQKVVKESSIRAYNNALVKIPVAQFGVAEEDIVRMTYDKFLEEFRAIEPYFVKKAESYLPAVYEYIHNRLDELGKTRLEKLNNKTAMPKKGDFLKNNIAGADAVVVVRGVGEDGYLVAYAPGMEEAEAGAFMGENIVPHSEMEQIMREGGYTPIKKQENELKPTYDEQGRETIESQAGHSRSEAGRLASETEPGKLEAAPATGRGSRTGGNRPVESTGRSGKPEAVNGFRIGEKVLYKGQEATIFDFENDGTPVLDTGMAPVIYEVGHWDNIQKMPTTVEQITRIADAKKPAKKLERAEQRQKRNQPKREKQKEQMADLFGRVDALEEKLNRQEQEIDAQLALLGEYKAGPKAQVREDMHTGAAKTLEKAARKFAKALASRLGGHVDGKDLSRGLTNIAPIGGEMTVRVWIDDGQTNGVYLSVQFDAAPDTQDFDKLVPRNGYWRIISDKDAYGVRSSNRNFDLGNVSELESGAFMTKVANAMLSEINRDARGAGQARTNETSNEILTPKEKDNDGRRNRQADSENPGRNEGTISDGRAEGNPPADQGLGTEARQEAERTEPGRDGRGVHGDYVSDTTGSGRVSERDGEQQSSVNEPTPVAASVKRNVNNWSYGETHLELPSGEIGKLKGNIEAIRTLKELEASEQPATPEQKQALLKFVGWGGLAEALNSAEYALWQNKLESSRRWGFSEASAATNWSKKWGKHYEDLRPLMTDEEWATAQASTLNSHYTPETVIRGLWEALEYMGFKGGSVLEPAMGVGHILGFMPKGISERSIISGFELDSIPGRIAKQLYPDADITVAGYETAFRPGSKDAVVTNVPFGQTAPVDPALDKALRKKLGSAYNLHNYFIIKGLLELRQGGVGAFITSSATMDGRNTKTREYIAGLGVDLVGAIRLPNNTFKSNAGTEVTADILFFRKRLPGEATNGIGFTSLTQVGTGKNKVTDKKGNDKMVDVPLLVNEYFAEHPEMMLGEVMTAHDAGSGGLYGGDNLTLVAHPGTELSAELADAIGRLPENVLEKGTVSGKTSVPGEATTQKDGTLSVKNGKVYVASKGELTEVASGTFKHNGKARSYADATTDYQAMKETLKELIQAEQTQAEDPVALRKKLNEQYDQFVEKYGRLNENKNLNVVMEEDPERFLPQALEKVETITNPTTGRRTKVVSKGTGILAQRVSQPMTEPTSAESLGDAIGISQAYRGRMDVDYIGQMLGIGADEARERILTEREAYEDPVTGDLIDRDAYLSGNIREKLEAARAAAEKDSRYEANVADLEKAMPESIPFVDIFYKMGTPWIPEDVYESFASEVCGIENMEIRYAPAIDQFVINKGYIADFTKSGNFATTRRNALQLFEDAINLRKPTIMKTVYVNGEERSVKDEQATQEAIQAIMDMNDAFVQYVQEAKPLHVRLTNIYNDRYNNYRLREYREPAFKGEDGKVHYPNANPGITLRTHQVKAVQRSLQGSTLLAHQVGTGKTFTMITTAMEMRRLGIAKKPMIVVQNATLQDFASDFMKLYPSAKILVPNETERSASQRKRLFNLIATGDFDAIIVPQSFLAFIPDDEGRKKAMIQARVDEIMNAAETLQYTDKRLADKLKREAEALSLSINGEEKGKKKNVKKEAKKEESALVRETRKFDRKTDDVLTFEQMGVDALFIDEAHNYKKIGFTTKMQNVKGVDTGYSERANSLYLKVSYVQEKNGGRNVILATGTPITNTMAEVWTMMRFVAPEILEDYGIRTFDEFAATFGQVEPSLEQNSTGGFKIADRFKSYVNVPELVKAFRSHADVVLTTDVEEFKESKNIPKLKDGQMTNHVIQKSDKLQEVMDVLINALAEDEKKSGKEKTPGLPLVVFSKAKQAAIDLRLINPEYPDDPNSKTNKVVSEVMRIYRESTPDKGIQMIFCDSYQSPANEPAIDLFEYDPSVPQFNLYRDIKDKLVKAGIPKDEIVIVSEITNAERKKAVFEKARAGAVRVLIGGTEKMGVGVNVQDRMIALHHMDAPIRPMDFEQRNGRILRQGNMFAGMDKPVEVLTYGVEGTLDATAYERLRIKQDFINQMMKGDVSGRVMEESDDEDPSGKTFSQMAAELSGDKTLQLLFVAENKVKRLEGLRRSHEMKREAARVEAAMLKTDIAGLRRKLKEAESMGEEIAKRFPEGIVKLTINGRPVTEKLSKVLAETLEDYEERYALNRSVVFPLIELNDKGAKMVFGHDAGQLHYSLFVDKFQLVDEKPINTYAGAWLSVNSALGNSGKRATEIREAIARDEARIKGAESIQEKDFDKMDELKEKRAEVKKLKEELAKKAEKPVPGSEAVKLALKSLKSGEKPVSLPEEMAGDSEESLDRMESAMKPLEEVATNTPEMVVAMGASDILKAMPNVSTMQFASIVKEASRPEVMAMYVPWTRQIIMLPKHGTVKEMRDKRWHESFHFGIDMVLPQGDAGRLMMERAASEADKLAPSLTKWVEDTYGNRNTAEEKVVHVLEEVISYMEDAGRVKALRGGLDFGSQYPVLNDVANRIINYLTNNGNGKESDDYSGYDEGNQPTGRRENQVRENGEDFAGVRGSASEGREEIRSFLKTGLPVSRLTGKEFEKKEDQTFVEQVTSFFKSQGGKASSAFGEVLLDQKGVKNSKSHGMSRIKAAAFAAVKDVLENGVVALPMDYYGTGGKKQPTGIIVAPIEIDNKRYYCAVEVIRNTENNRLYVHEAFAEEKVPDSVAASQVHAGESGSLQNQGEIAKLLQNILSDNVLGQENEEFKFSLREKPVPKKTGIGYKVFVVKDGKLYPPMVANPGGADTPVGVWLDADAATVAGESKTGRLKVKAGGKGTQGGSGTLAYRPGWHLGEIPYALQFNRKNPETGEKELFPANFVWAEVEYANDRDYQEEAMSYGINPSGKFQHSLAGLPRVPEDGAYRYRTNPNPETDPWVITGAMKVNRLLTPSEVDAMVIAAGREPQLRQESALTDADIDALNRELLGGIKFGLRGKPRRKAGESLISYNRRLKEWQAEVDEAKRTRDVENMDVENPLDTELNDLAMEMMNHPSPIRKRGESDEDFNARQAEWIEWYNTRRPEIERRIAEIKVLLESEKAAARNAEMNRVDEHLYDGTIPEQKDSEGQLSDEEMREVREIFQEKMGDMGIAIDKEQAKRDIKQEIIERRRYIETSNLEDTFFVDEVKRIASGQKDDNWWIHKYKLLEKDLSEKELKRAIQNLRGKHAKEVLKAIPDYIEGTYAGEVTPELVEAAKMVSDWFEEVYNLMAQEGVLYDAAKIQNYVTHIWDWKRSPMEAQQKFNNYVNTMRLRSPFTKHRVVPTYKEGIAMGMVPKYEDITGIIQEYGHYATETIANKRMLEFLKTFKVFVPGNEDNLPMEVDLIVPETVRDPMYQRMNHTALDGYKVLADYHKYIKPVFGDQRILDHKQMSNFANKLTQGLWTTSSTMKKVALSFSFFHHGALTETAIAMLGPAKAGKVIAKNLIWDVITKGNIPALNDKEAARDAVKHLVSLGASNDYVTADVNNLTGTLYKLTKDKNIPVARQAAWFLDFLNRGSDKFLWDTIHDGFKIASFAKMAKETRAKAEREGWSQMDLEKALDECGHLVNDTFGGLHFDILGFSPKEVRIMRALLLSPDWTLATIRQALSPLGFGKLYGNEGFWKTIAGGENPVRTRKKYGRQFWVTAMIFFYALMNGLNAYFRIKDEDEQKRIADEKRKTDPDYKSPYELAYPNGMKWYDYTMPGNTLSHQTHLFTGRYEDGTETYARWGKQFRELPELFFGRDGFSIPGPMIDKMSGKANPLMATVFEFVSGYSLSGWENQYMKGKKGLERDVARLYLLASKFVPYSVPTQEDKDFYWLDLIMPSSKGFTPGKAINYFEKAIKGGDMNYVSAVYDACVKNGLDPEKYFDVAKARIEATAKANMLEGVETVQDAAKLFDEAKDVKEKKRYLRYMEQQIGAQDYHPIGQEEILQEAKDVISGEPVTTKGSEYYLEHATSEDVLEDYRMKKNAAGLKKYYQDYTELMTTQPEAGRRMLDEKRKFIEGYVLTTKSRTAINRVKKAMLDGRIETEQGMKEIRRLRKEYFSRMDEMELK